MKQGIIYFVIAVVVGGTAFYLGRHTSSSKSEEKEQVNKADKASIKELRHSGGYKFINPLLECDNYYPAKSTSLEVLENQLQGFINGAVNSKRATKISLYYRDLNNGPWIGIGENEYYSPASLLKVPIMIAALKYTETNPDYLKKKIRYTKHTDDDIIPNIKDQDLIKVGNSYTIEQLIEYMIISSDNEAKNLILMNLPEEVLDNTYADLDIIVPGIRTPDDFMSVKDYSSFFRILYNATYLNRPMSEKAMEILSRANFKSGLRNGVPEGTLVCNKFGERGIPDSNLKQLHDCGVIYTPGRPYLICVMTRGEDWEELAGIISEISGIVYQWQNR